MSDILKDLSAERGCLAGIFRYGFDSYADISDIISDSTFTDNANKIIFKCCRSIFERDSNSVIDLPILMAEATSLGFKEIISEHAEIKHIKALFDYPIAEFNVRKMAAKIRKLEIARQYKEVLRTAVGDLNQITGDERLSDIVGLIEAPVHQFSTSLSDGSNNEPKTLTNVREYVENIRKNPKRVVGISSGFARFDAAIGGGFRPGTVNVIGARPKVGKTFLCGNIGMHVAHNLKIPVLMLDTEMIETDQYTRQLGIISGINMNDIESGAFVDDPLHDKRIDKAAEFLDQENNNFYYLNISGKDFEDILSLMRRWIMRVVGKDENGHTKPCLIIYDYIKLMDSGSITAQMQEYQALGFLMTSMHNLAVQYMVPIFATVQLNRDGIDDESTAVVSGSDRIIWLCTNFSIYKYKTAEEVAVDGLENGTHKLINLAARHGPGMSFGDYLSMKFVKHTGKITESKTKAELGKQDGNSNQRIEIDGEEAVPFE